MTKHSELPDYPGLRRAAEQVERLTESFLWPVYEDVISDQLTYGIHTVLIPNRFVELSSRSHSWDLPIGENVNGYVTTFPNGRAVTRYERNHSRVRAERIIFRLPDEHRRLRRFTLNQEMETLFSIYEKDGTLYRRDDEGEDHCVAKFVTGSVTVCSRELLEFAAATRSHLCFQFDIGAYFHDELDDEAGPFQFTLDTRRDGAAKKDNGFTVADFYAGNLDIPHDDARSLSRFLGKRFVKPPPLSRYYKFRGKQKRYASFKIGHNERGGAIVESADPSRLSDHFGGNAGRPHYLTPVLFRASVLDKYIADPSRYEISDGVLRRKGEWLLRFDNDRYDHYCAYLGDLGRDLPYGEQEHWASHNILDDVRLSETYFRRSVLAEPTRAGRADLRIRGATTELNEAWRTRFGFNLWRAPTGTDAELLDSLFIPSRDAPHILDQWLIRFSKLFVDLIDEKSIRKRLRNPEKGGTVSALNRYLSEQELWNGEDIVESLRSLWGLRAKKAAHPSSKSYEKELLATLGVDSLNEAVHLLAFRFVEGCDSLTAELGSNPV